MYPQTWNVTVNVKGMGIHLLCRGVAKPPPLCQRTLASVYQNIQQLSTKWAVPVGTALALCSLHGFLVNHLSLDKVGGAALAQGDAGGYDHGVPVLNQLFL